MIQRNQATRTWRSERCLRKALKRWGLRFWILRAARGRPVLQGRKRLPEEECGSQEQRTAVWLILNESSKSQMEIPGNGPDLHKIWIGADQWRTPKHPGIIIANGRS